MTTMVRLPVYLVRGDDPTVVSDAVRLLVSQLVGDADAGLMVEEVGGDTHEVSDIVDAAQTPPFLSDHRVLIGRDIGRFVTAQLAPLVAYLGDPSATTSLVLVGGGGTISRTLVEAVRRVGHLVEAAVPTGRARGSWLAKQIKDGPVRLDAGAAALVGEHLGDDMSRLGSLLDTLASAYGPGVKIGVVELGPFLGQAGSVAPWELTDAIDRGDAAAALAALHRLVGAGDRHPLVILATLQNHVARMLRLDGAGITNEGEAAAALGMSGSTFRAAKALRQTRTMGHDGIVTAIGLLAEADLALKGAVDWPGELVLEVLVARLSRLASRR